MPSIASQHPTSPNHSERTPLLAQAAHLPSHIQHTLPLRPPHLPRDINTLDILRSIYAFWLEFQIGMGEAALGSLLGPIQEDYGISYGAVGVVTVADAVGRFVGSLAAPAVVGYVGLAGIFYITTALLALSCALNLPAPPWPVVLLALSLTGLASGALKPSLSTYIAHFHHGPLMSFVYAGEGLGALVQPFLVSGMLAKEWGWNVYFWVPLVLAVLDLPLAWVLFRGYEPPKDEDEEEEEGERGSGVRKWWRVAKRPIVIYGAILQALAYSAEDITSTWISIFMSDIRHGQQSRMQLVLSGYWAGETASRTFVASITHSYGPRLLITLYLVCAGVALGVLQFVPHIIADAVAVGVFGFFIGPVIPTVLTTVSDALPSSAVQPANSILMAAGVIGSGAAPSLVGAINSAGGLGWMPVVLLGVVAGTGVVWLVCWREVRGMERKEGGGGGGGEEGEEE